MNNKFDELRWKLYNKKFTLLLLYGAKKGLVRTYDKELLDNLRNVNYGGLPATILLLHAGLTNGYCYDRGTIVTLGFGDDDFNVVDAEIDSLKLNPLYIAEYRSGKKDELYADHCFAERIDKNGITWVYDTSIGLVIEKNLYYKMENPKVRVINNREKTLEFLYYDFQKDSDIERDKYALPLILPNIESRLIPTQPFYFEQLKEEINLLKNKVNYDGICEEITNDMLEKGLIDNEEVKTFEKIFFSNK